VFGDGDGTEPPTLSIDPVVEERQLKRLAEVKQHRDDGSVGRALGSLTRNAADPTVNLMDDLLECARSRVTVGEVTAALESVFGTWTEPRGA
jgi:methylmalonyl-CoA mutase N-terminal domain/subunit